MCEELKKGDILYVVSNHFLDILEVEKIAYTLDRKDRFMYVKCVSIITSTRHIYFLPENIKNIRFVEHGLDIITCDESIAVALHANNVEIDEQNK
jgi:hypothetical protein